MRAEPEKLDLPRRLVADWPLAAWDGVHVLAAVSGGADSMALLRALVAAKASAASVARSSGAAGRVFAGHVNHQLRGRGSDDDEAWLREECHRLGVPLVVRRSNTAALAARDGDGIEAAARDERYRLLVEMADEVGARFVATAHTRDDQAETVLFRLVRGSGLRGLAGMPRSRALSPSVTLVRPLLACGREDSRTYLKMSVRRGATIRRTRERSSLAIAFATNYCRACARDSILRWMRRWCAWPKWQVKRRRLSIRWRPTWPISA